MSEHLESQNNQIRDYLEKGHYLTPIEALNLFGCFRLSARIWDLIHLQNVNIVCEMVHKNKKRFAKYSIVA